MRNLFYIFLLFSFIQAKAQQTYTISGTVSDEKGGALSGATVYISNSTYITSADNNGKYYFSKIQPGDYQVVAKMIGFIVNIQSVNIENKSVILNPKLTESNTTLKTVTINGKVDPNRKRYMELFIRNFIGETQNAADCKILNPEILKFDYDKKTDVLRASADEFIVIENKSLGYRLKYTLTMFRYNVRNNIYSATGYPYFEAMQGTTSQQKRWDDNRREAYQVSKRHFMRALNNKTAQKEGYTIFKTGGNYKPDFIDINTILNWNVIESDSSAAMYTIYLNKKPVALLLYRKKTNGFLVGGIWSQQRMADLTPVDYFVEPLAEGKKK